MNRAIIFFACYDGYHFRASRISAKSAKGVMSDVDTVLITERLDWTDSSFDKVIHIPKPHPEAVTFPPLWTLPEEYDSGIYVGSEKIFCAPVYEAFELVENDRVDIAMPSTSGKARVDHQFPSPDVPIAFPSWRTGFLAFQYHQRMRDFFIAWKAEFDDERAKYGHLRNQQSHPDQPSLRTTLYRSDLSIVTLPDNYCCTCGDVIIRGTVKACGFYRGVDYTNLAKEANRLAPHVRLFVRGKSRRLDL